MSQNPRILVVGDVMLDRYIHGTVERISPEAPIPILRQTHIEDRPGGAANVAMNLRSLGAEVTLVGAIGADPDGDILSTMVGKACKRHLTLNAVMGRTEVKKRMVCGGQQMLRVDQEASRPTDRALGDILQAVRGKIPTVDAMVLSDYAGGVLDDPQLMVERARQHRIPVYVDPKGANWERYRGATLIKPNEAEAREQFEWDTPEEMRRGACHMMTLHDIEAMLITRGAGGMTLVLENGRFFHQRAMSGLVVDVTGAGDTVLAAVAYLRAKFDFQDEDCWPAVLECAAKAAASVCARHGTALATMLDMEIA